MNPSHIVRRVLCAAALIGAAGVASAQVRISQVYGGGGNGGSAGNAIYLADFVEIYNPGAPVDISGWSVQITSSAGTFSAANTVAIPAATTIGTGQYLLVRLANGTSVPAGQSLDLPAATVTGATLALSATDFKVALVSNATALASGTPTYTGNPTLVDFVGAGTANWNDASASGVTHTTANNAPAPSNTNALIRRSCGALDTPNSYLDWGRRPPQPAQRGHRAQHGPERVRHGAPVLRRRRPDGEAPGFALRLRRRTAHGSDRGDGRLELDRRLRDAGLVR